MKDPEQATKEVEKALNILKELGIQYQLRFAKCWSGIYYLRMGSITRAQKTSDELIDMIDEGLNKKAMRYLSCLKGAIELEKKNYASAIENFNIAIPLMPFQSTIFDQHAFFIEPLARALYISGIIFVFPHYISLYLKRMEKYFQDILILISALFF